MKKFITREQIRPIIRNFVIHFLTALFCLIIIAGLIFGVITLLTYFNGPAYWGHNGMGVILFLFLGALIGFPLFFISFYSLTSCFNLRITFLQSLLIIPRKSFSTKDYRTICWLYSGILFVLGLCLMAIIKALYMFQVSPYIILVIVAVCALSSFVISKIVYDYIVITKTEHTPRIPIVYKIINHFFKT